MGRMTTRRRDLLLALGAGVALAAGEGMGPTPLPAPASPPQPPPPPPPPPPPAPPARSKRVLVLGGTGFVGPSIVRACQAQGHVVTLFNRGKTAPGLFPSVETILGDRVTEL